MWAPITRLKYRLEARPPRSFTNLKRTRSSAWSAARTLRSACLNCSPTACCAVSDGWPAGAAEVQGPGFGPDFGTPAAPGGRDRAAGRGPGLGFGRWQMFVRHRAGSLEVVVAQARRRNLAVTTGVLLLMMASAAALIRFTRRAQRLAQLQMDFVTGVSHELRTPLTVIHTAAYNLRGAVANSPAQVEKYGAIIQKESGRLKELVEQVLRFARFASGKAGQVIQEREPVSVATVIEETIESSKTLVHGQCVLEKNIEPGLPLILADASALKQALQNLLSNAAKYGTGKSNWIGVSASKTSDNGQVTVEIRVADRGRESRQTSRSTCSIRSSGGGAPSRTRSTAPDSA